MPGKTSHTTTRNAPASGRLDAVLAAALLAVCAAVVAGLAWTQPARTALVLPYAQHGQVSYSAPSEAGTLYGTNGLHTGQPVYDDVVPLLSVGYRYGISASVPVDIRGTEQLIATVSDGLGATQTIALQPNAVHFAGRAFTSNGTLDMNKLAAGVVKLASSAGSSAPANYKVSISPAVSAQGELGGHSLKLSFDQSVIFNYIPASHSAPASLTPAGSAQAAASATTTSSTPSIGALSSSATGSVEVFDGAAKSLFLGISVSTARIVSLALLAASILVLVLIGRPVLADASSDNERVRIATRHGSSLVEVDALPASSRAAVVDVHSFDGLLRVSRRLECPVLHCPSKGVYAVVDSGTLYRYSIASFRAAAHEPHTNGHMPQSGSLAATGTHLVDLP